jgi:hypothetical protein
MFVESFLAVRSSVMTQATRLETIQNTPNPELVKTTELVQQKRARLEDVLAPQIKLRIPWYHCLASAVFFGVELQLSRTAAMQALVLCAVSQRGRAEQRLRRRSDP